MSNHRETTYPKRPYMCEKCGYDYCICNIPIGYGPNYNPIQEIITRLERIEQALKELLKKAK